MKTHIYSKEQLICLLKEWVQKNGKIPSKRQLNEDVSMPSDMAYRKAFGSWGNAVRECGYEPLKPQPSEKCVKNMIKAHKGKRSFAWKGGKITNAKGYIEIWEPEHKNAKKNGYVLEHRYIMSQIIGRPLEKNEDVHHINGKKNDNSPQNLKLIQKSEHTKHHMKNNKAKYARKNKSVCEYPGCEQLTASKYGLCNKHYKSQWQRLKTGIITDIKDFSEIDRKHTEETKELLRQYAKLQKRKSGRFYS